MIPSRNAAAVRHAYAGSRLALGTWPMSGDGRYGPVDDAEAVRTIRCALDLGVSVFDTAPGYGEGHAEEILGEGLRGRRQQAFVVSKFGVVAGQPGRPGRNASRAWIVSEIERSLQRLKTDYIDAYLVHWPDPQTPLEETLAALDELVRAGKVKAVGVCNFDLELLRACQGIRPLDVLQVGYNLFDRRMEREVFPFCREQGIAVMAYGPLAHGLLAGSIPAHGGFAPKDWRARGVVIGQPIFGDNLAHNVRVAIRLNDEVAAPRGMSLAQLAVAWVLRNADISTAILGARSRAELREDIAPGHCLAEADLAAIAVIMEEAVGRVEAFRPFGWAMEAWR